MEELKLVLETIKTISGDASHVAIWWVILHYTIGLLKTLALCSAVVGIVYLIVKGVSSTSDWASAGKSVAQAHGGNAGYFYEKSDQTAIQKAIAASNK